MQLTLRQSSTKEASVKNMLTQRAGTRMKLLFQKKEKKRKEKQQQPTSPSCFAALKASLDNGVLFPTLKSNESSTSKNTQVTVARPQKAGANIDKLFQWIKKISLNILTEGNYLSPAGTGNMPSWGTHESKVVPSSRDDCSEYEISGINIPIPEFENTIWKFW